MIIWTFLLNNQLQSNLQSVNSYLRSKKSCLIVLAARLCNSITQSLLAQIILADPIRISFSSSVNKHLLVLRGCCNVPSGNFKSSHQSSVSRVAVSLLPLALKQEQMGAAQNGFLTGDRNMCTSTRRWIQFERHIIFSSSF